MSFLEKEEDGSSRSRMMQKKRDRPPRKDEEEEEALGVFAFCAALNGDDPLAADKMLRRFVVTVQRERRRAFLSPRDYQNPPIRTGTVHNHDHDDDDDDDDCDGSEDEDDDTDEEVSNKKKKKKKEEWWKEDTQDYNVPFVGTFVAKGPTGVVQENEWPTGFLKAYLTESPSALELLSNPQLMSSSSTSLWKRMIQHHGLVKGDRFQALYFDALTQLILPPSSSLWLEGESRDVVTERMVSILMKEHVSKLCVVLQDTTGGDAHRRGGGGGGGGGGRTQPASVYRLLAALASSSIGSAREVARYLDAHLKDGILRASLKQPQPKQKPVVVAAAAAADNDNDANKTMQEATMIRKSSKKTVDATRASALQLATLLLETNDVTVWSYITTPGQYGKESSSSSSSKTTTTTTTTSALAKRHNPGICHLALRIGLHDSQLWDSKNPHWNQNRPEESSPSHPNAYLQALAKFFMAIQRNLLQTPSSIQQSHMSHNNKHKTSLQNRVLCDLFMGEPIDRILRIAFLAPDLSELLGGGSSGSISTGPEESYSGLEMVATEACRLMIQLFSDSSSSPFLIHINNHHANATNNDAAPDTTANKDAILTKSYLHMLARHLRSLVSQHPHNLSIRSFVIKCVKTTPLLLQSTFRTMPIPDPPRPTFSCISAFAYMAQLMRDAPPLAICLQAMSTSNTTTTTAAAAGTCTIAQEYVGKPERWLPFLMPTGLTKSNLGKAIQSSNALFVTQTLKLMMVILERAHTCMEQLRSKHEQGKFTESLADAVLKKLPDVQALLAVRSKFDPFSESHTSASSSLLGYSIVTIHLFQVICLYAKVLPRQLQTIKFDWTKLLPEDPNVFLRSNKALQYGLLHVLQILASPNEYATEGNVKFSSKAFRFLVNITLSTQVTKIYGAARDLAIAAILQTCNMDETSSPEQVECLKYEATLWVDGATDTMLMDLVKLFEKAEKSSLPHIISVAQSWMHFFPSSSDSMGDNCFSPLLSTALATVCGSENSYSEEMSFLTFQIVAKCLFFHRNASPLAAYVCHCDGNHNPLDNSADSMDLSETSSSRQLVVCYSRMLISEQTALALTKQNMVSTINSRLFGRDSFHSHLSTVLSIASSDLTKKSMTSMIPNADRERDISFFDYISSHAVSFDDSILFALQRQCLHHIQITKQSAPLMRDYNRVLRFLTSLLLQTKDQVMIKSCTDALFIYPETFNDSTEAGCIALLCLSQSVGLRREYSSEVHGFLAKKASELEGIIQSSNGMHKMLISKKMWQMSLLFSLIGPMCKATYRMPFIVALLEKACSETSYHSLHLLPYLNHALEFLNAEDRGFSDDSWSLFPITQGFNMWVTTMKQIQVDDASDVMLEFAKSLESVFCYILGRSKIYGRSASLLYLEVVRFSPDVVMEIYLKLKLAIGRTSNSNSKSTEKCFLTAFLKYDARMFAPSLLKTIANIESAGEVRELWENGDLDGVVATMFLELGRLHGYNDMIDVKSQQKAVTNLLTRVSKVVNKINEVSPPCFMELMSVPSILMTTAESSVLDKLFGAITEMFMNQLLDKKYRGRCRNAKEQIILQSATAIMLSMNEIQSEASDAASNLASATFVRLCALLPRSLRKYYQNVTESDRKNSDQSSSSEVLQLLSIVTSTSSFGESILRHGIPHVQTCILACLKYGLIEPASEEDSIISSACLKLVGTLMKDVRIDESSLHILSEMEVLRPTQINTMISLHSQFSNAFLAKEFSIQPDTMLRLTKDWTPKGSVSQLGLESSKIELLTLLLYCASNCPEPATIPTDTWSIVLKGYNAGVSKVDRLLHQLIRIYEHSQIKGMDDMCWGQLRETLLSESTSNEEKSQLGGDDYGRSWEWFFEALDMSRVRSTLCQFPTWDQIDNEESRLTENMVVDGEEDEDGDDLSVTLENTVVSNKEKESEQTSQMEIANSSMTYKKESEATKEWFGDDSDNRYSPAFVLPLVLGVLDSFIPTSGIKRGKPQNHDETSQPIEHEQMEEYRDERECAQHETFVTVTRRLIDKGALALALAGLSSKCPTLRQMSVSIIGLILQALHTQEAYNLSTWRERPQLAMLVDSIQRGLTIRRAMQVQRKAPDDSKDMMIPMMPAVSAVFLARSSLILAKPDDSMFASMNRFYLRLEDYHGGYRDCFRLPAFMSLFCSSSESPGQARRERLWALQLLSDGTVDSYCYKVAARCHAPELLLTFFDTSITRGDTGGDDVERGLILDVLIRMLHFGSSVAPLHLVSRVGLLSWIHSLVEGRPSLSIPIRIKIVKLLHAAVKAANTHEILLESDPKDFMLKLTGASSSVIWLCTDFSKLTPTSLQQTNMDKIPLVESGCECLRMMSLVADQARSKGVEATDALISCSGISLKSSLAMISCVTLNWETKANSYLPMLIEAICLLPFGILEEDTDEERFAWCSKILLIVLGNNCHEVMHQLLKRILLILKVSQSMPPSSCSLLETMLRCRQDIVVNNEGEDSWIQCLSLLSRNTSKMEDKQTIAEIAQHLVAHHTTTLS